MQLTRALSELSALFSILSHPLRLRIVEELGSTERSVGDLAEATHVAQAIASQQPSLLRAQRILSQRRAGRHVFYKLNHPELAGWVAQGFDFLTLDANEVTDMSRSVRQAKRRWGKPGKTRRLS